MTVVALQRNFIQENWLKWLNGSRYIIYICFYPDLLVVEQYANEIIK